MIYKTRHFARWAQKTELSDSMLRIAVLEIQIGLLDADLGGGIVKKRIALPGRGKRSSTRTLLATNLDDRWFFVFGFEKNERENISENELATLIKLVKDLLSLTAAQIAVAIGEGSLLEVEHEKQEV
ncbi:MAG: type II toxin-antitoxin system RelE/ParE family toxin [Proteobacteria bacterium]|nr:type II toxin-antitoxin system RelE/ParE family toxin [Pseudomonadota bacterium]